MQYGKALVKSARCQSRGCLGRSQRGFNYVAFRASAFIAILELWALRSSIGSWRVRAVEQSRHCAPGGVRHPSCGSRRAARPPSKGTMNPAGLIAFDQPALRLSQPAGALPAVRPRKPGLAAPLLRPPQGTDGQKGPTKRFPGLDPMLGRVERQPTLGRRGRDARCACDPGRPCASSRKHRHGFPGSHGPADKELTAAALIFG